MKMKVIRRINWIELLVHRWLMKKFSRIFRRFLRILHGILSLFGNLCIILSFDMYEMSEEEKIISKNMREFQRRVADVFWDASMVVVDGL